SFLRFLQFLASSIELTTHHSLRAPIAKEACPIATDVDYSRNLHPKINTHHPVLLDWLWFLKSHSEIGYPLAPFLLETQETRKPYEIDFSTLDLNLLCLPTLGDWQGEYALLDVPILIVPLTDGLLENRKYFQL